MADLAGLPLEQMNYIVCSIIQFALCFAFYGVEGSTARRIFSAISGMTIGFLFHGANYWSMLFEIMLGIVVIKTISNRRVAGYLMFTIFFLFFMGRASYEMIILENGISVKNLLVAAAYQTHMVAMNYIDSGALIKEKKDPKAA